MEINCRKTDSYTTDKNQMWRVVACIFFVNIRQLGNSRHRCVSGFAENCALVGIFSPSARIRCAGFRAEGNGAPYPDCPSIPKAPNTGSVGGLCAIYLIQNPLSSQAAAISCILISIVNPFAAPTKCYIPDQLFHSGRNYLG